jgi:hypothetical protein
MQVFFVTMIGIVLFGLFWALLTDNDRMKPSM